MWSYRACLCVCFCLLAYIQSRCGEEDMCGLGDICSMEAVVVRYVSMVMILQGHHVCDKSVSGDTKCLQELPLLRREERSRNVAETQTSGEIRGDLFCFTWKMVYMMQLRGLLFENSATLNMLKLHLFRSSSSWWNTQRYMKWGFRNQVAEKG